MKDIELIEKSSRTKVVSRRAFLRYGVGAIAGFIAAALGIPLAGYAVGPALRKKQTTWLEVGSVGSIPLGVPTKLDYIALKVDGWVEEKAKRSVWVLTRDGQSFVAYDPRCTHLGCAYSWQADKNRFFCPCHDGIYDIDGRVIGGPPPRPLDRYETKVEGGKLYIGAMYSVDAALRRVSG